MKRKYGKRRSRKLPYKKRRTQKRRRVKRTKKAMGLSNNARFSGFPGRNIVRLRYAERIDIAPAAPASFGFHNFCANGIWDPNITGTGHQPMGFDQWAGFYNHYVVIGSKITVKWQLGTPNEGLNVIFVGTKITDDAGPIITTGNLFENLSERGFSYKMFNPNSNMIRPVTTRSSYSPKKFFNVANVKDNFDRLGALVTANPTEQAVYQLWYANSRDVSLGGVLMQAFVTIDYIVMFSEPKDIAQS